MAGYINEQEGYQPVDKPARRNWWKFVLFGIAYAIPLFWLFDRIDYPDSLGVHISARGKTGTLEEWYYSYLLLERHHALDVVTLIYMWAPVIGFAGWLAARKLRGTKFSLYSDPAE